MMRGSAGVRCSCSAAMGMITPGEKRNVILHLTSETEAKLKERAPQFDDLRESIYLVPASKSLDDGLDEVS